MTPAPEDPGYWPEVLIVTMPDRCIFDLTAKRPLGTVIHGTRGGNATREQEWEATLNWARSGPWGKTRTGEVYYLGWLATIYDDAIALHMPWRKSGWHAGELSETFYGVEFVQPTERDDITDGQVRAYGWLHRQLRQRHEGFECNLLAHSETPQGVADGKSDVFPVWDPRLAELKRRLIGAAA